MNTHRFTSGWLKGRATIENTRVEIRDKKVFVPVSVEHEYVREDGLSFGFPDESGWFTRVTYEQAHGIIADDLIDKIDEYNAAKTHPVRIPQPRDYFEFTGDQIEENTDEAMRIKAELIIEHRGYNIYRCCDKYYAHVMRYAFDEWPAAYKEISNPDAVQKFVSMCVHHDNYEDHVKRLRTEANEYIALLKNSQENKIDAKTQ